MKKYRKISEVERIQKIQQQREELRFFQDQLRNQSRLNEIYHGKALEIAEGLQPWIDALDIHLKNLTAQD